MDVLFSDSPCRRCTERCVPGCERFVAWEDACYKRMDTYEGSSLSPWQVLELRMAKAQGRLISLPEGLTDEEKSLIYDVFRVVMRSIKGKKPERGENE